MDNKINFSFVIPHYNSPELLAKCLSTIPRRQDVEIIVVDDCSSPDVVDFGHFPGLDDPQVQVVFSKKNGGCAYAANQAMDRANGKWIIRGDADDYFLPGIVEAMNEYADSDADLVFFKGTSVDLLTGESAHRADAHNMFVDRAINDNDFRYLFCTSLPTCRFYKREFLEKHHLRLHEVRWSTEVTFWAKCAVLAESYVASPIEIYCLTASPGTLTQNKSSLCLRTRCEENNTEVSILRPKFGHFEHIYYWQYRTWFNLHCVDKVAAFRMFCSSVSVGRGDFLRQWLKYFPADAYNNSSRLKTVYQKLKHLVRK